VRKVLVLSVPSHKEEKCVLADFDSAVDCATAIVEIRVPPSEKTDQSADLREFPMVQQFCYRLCDNVILCRLHTLFRIEVQPCPWTPPN
jgi:hypothetical protein